MADTLDLGSNATSVQVQVLSSVPTVRCKLLHRIFVSRNRNYVASLVGSSAALGFLKCYALDSPSACGHPYQKKTTRKGCLFSCDSGLETKLLFVGKRHCVCLPLHAVQLAQRFASKLARLCYYARFAHYKSCHPYHLCSTKKLQNIKSIRFSRSGAFLLFYLVVCAHCGIFVFMSCILTYFSKNRT